jgi:hypothetical protein
MDGDPLEVPDEDGGAGFEFDEDWLDKFIERLRHEVVIRPDDPPSYVIGHALRHFGVSVICSPPTGMTKPGWMIEGHIEVWSALDPSGRSKFRVVYDHERPFSHTQAMIRLAEFDLHKNLLIQELEARGRLLPENDDD